VKQYFCDEIDWVSLKNICHEMLVTHHLQPNPHVVDFKGYCVNPPYVYVMMELCDAGSLYQALKERKYSQIERCRHALQCVGAISFLHSENFLHRDIKSLNFICKYTADEGLRIKLCDFGESVKLQAERGRRQTVIACDMPSLDQVGDSETRYNIHGTLQWMAPEIMDGCLYTKSADVYSCAVVVWECLTQRVPYEVSEGVDMKNIRSHVRDGGRLDCKSLAP